MQTMIPKRTSGQEQNTVNTQVPPVIEQQPERSTFVGNVFGIWLSGVFFVALVGRTFLTSTTDITILLAISINWPLIYFMFSEDRIIPARVTTGRIIALALFALFTIGSIGISPTPDVSLTYFILTLMAILLALQFNAALSPEALEKGLKISSVLILSCLLVFTFYEYTPGYRLGNARGIMNPNAIGIVAISVMITGMVHRKVMFQAIIVVLGGAVIFLTGSRATGISALLGLAVIFALRYQSASFKRKGAVIAAVIVLSCVGVFFLEILLVGAESYFAFDDSHRGIESGASGRIWAWKETWELFLAHPFFGVGFRAHSHFLARASSSHNGYLALLAEVGLVAAVSMFYLIVSGVIAIGRRLKDKTYIWTEAVMMGLVVACLFLAIFERYLINIGNPTSLLLIVAILRPNRRLNRQPTNAHY